MEEKGNILVIFPKGNDVQWSNNKRKIYFPNNTYFEGKFKDNYPKGEGIRHFINGNITKEEFTHEIKEKKEIIFDWKIELVK